MIRHDYISILNPIILEKCVYFWGFLAISIKWKKNLTTFITGIPCFLVTADAMLQRCLLPEVWQLVAPSSHLANLLSLSHVSCMHPELPYDALYLS